MPEHDESTQEAVPLLGKLLGKDGKSLGELLVELKQVTVDYTKQETLEPLKKLGKYLAFGSIAMVLFGIGFTLWVVAGLRALQNETGSTFTGALSWAPYFITFVVTVVVIALAAYAIGKEKRASTKRKAAREAGVV